VFRDLSVDSFVIAHFLGAEQVAMYGLASTLILFANALNPATLLRSVLTPLLTARHATGGGQPELLRAFRLLNKLVMLLHWPLVTLLLVLGVEVIRLVYIPGLCAGLRAAGAAGRLRLLPRADLSPSCP
jgi:O-antigen/teichoic acid export membrane protein